MGRGSDEQAGGRPIRYDSQDDRDRSIERYYTLGCDCCRSLLMACACHSDELLTEYMAWAHRRAVPHVFDQGLLREWMEGRFGAAPYLSALSLMLYVVKVAVFGDPYASLARRPRKPGMGVQKMPRPRLSNREWNDARNAAAARERDLPVGDRSEAP
jgi:hypothetical protein